MLDKKRSSSNQDTEIKDSFSEPSLHWFANNASHFNNIGRLDERTAISDMRMRLQHSDDRLRLECRITHPLLDADDVNKLSCAFNLRVKVSLSF